MAYPRNRDRTTTGRRAARDALRRLNTHLAYDGCALVIADDRIGRRHAENAGRVPDAVRGQPAAHRGERQRRRAGRAFRSRRLCAPAPGRHHLLTTLV